MSRRVVERHSGLFAGVMLFRAGVRDGLDCPGEAHTITARTFRAGTRLGRRFARP